MIQIFKSLSLYSKNRTLVSEFWIQGFQISHTYRILMFSCFLLIYIMIVMGNLLITILIYSNHRLHLPMYIFLCNLSLSEIFFTTSIIPNMLYVIVSGGGVMSYAGCLAQFYVFGSLISTECFLLAVMSYDRYLAICIPLRYNFLMNSRVCFQFSLFSWLSGFLLSVITIVFMTHISFCGSNLIDHFLCDFAPLLNLACSDISQVELQVFVLSISIIVFPFTFIVLTYLSIIRTILSIPSTSGRQKAFSTCSSHLIIVSLYYGTLMFMYSAPSLKMFQNASKPLSLLYIVVTPLCNPIIYSLRSHEIRYVFQKTVTLKIVLYCSGRQT